MLALLFSDLANIDYLISHPWLLAFLAFQIWMLVDAIKKQEWFWVVFIIIFPLLNAILYYFMIYRPAKAVSGGGRTLELPGSGDRRRIKELENQIHHLDKAHHHSELGDIFLRQGKLPEAEQSYLAALERDPADIDTKAHLGQALARQNRLDQARELLEEVCAENPKHDYGQSLMSLADLRAGMGNVPGAIDAWTLVLKSYSYARARVQLAELYLLENKKEAARKELEEVISEDTHSSRFERERDKAWVKKARKLLKDIAAESAS